MWKVNVPALYARYTEAEVTELNEERQQELAEWLCSVIGAATRQACVAVWEGEHEIADEQDQPLTLSGRLETDTLLVCQAFWGLAQKDPLARCLLPRRSASP
jgi:hypothetical protein